MPGQAAWTIPVVGKILTRWGQQDAGVEMLITVTVHTGTHTNGQRKDFLALVHLRPWLAQGPAKIPSRGLSAPGKIPATPQTLLNS